MVVGRAVAVMLQSMLLGDTNIHWSQSIKYLGVYFASGKTQSFDVNPMKRAFYAACNFISRGLSQQIVSTILVKIELSSKNASVWYSASSARTICLDVVI